MCETECKIKVDALIGSERVPGFSPPQHRHTWKALARIVAATHELLLERGPDGTSLIEVAGVADVSTSSLYRRFQRKSALLDYAHAVHSRQNQAAICGFLDELEASCPPVIELTTRLFRFGIDNARRSGPLSHALRRAGLEVPSILEREAEAERGFIDRIEEVTLKAWDGDVTDHGRAGIRDTIRVFLPLVREGGEKPGVTAMFPDLDDEALAARLATLALQSSGYSAHRSSPTASQEGRV